MHQGFGELAGRGVCTQTGHLPSPEAEIIRISRLAPDSLVEEKGRIISPAWVSSQFSSFADIVNEGLGPARADVRARVVSIRRGRTLRRFGPSRSRARRSSPIIHEWAKPSCCKACSGGIRCVGSLLALLLNRAAYKAGQPQRPAPSFQRNGVASVKGVNAPEVPVSRECPDSSLETASKQAHPAPREHSTNARMLDVKWATEVAGANSNGALLGGYARESAHPEGKRRDLDDAIRPRACSRMEGSLG